MKKIIFLSIAIIVINYFHLPSFEAKAIDKDWTFDPKTSTLIPNYLGKVKALNGKALTGDNELQKGSKIYNNQSIQTAEKSFIVIEMIDLTTITLGPLSNFKVENWSFRTKNDRTATFVVLKGQWRALIKSKSQDDDQLKITTSLASMGVRGTELLVNVDKIGDTDITQVALLEGNIHLEGDLPKNSKKDLVAGDYVVMEKNSGDFNQQEKTLLPEEIKSYQEFTSPDILRLLDPMQPTALKLAFISPKLLLPTNEKDISSEKLETTIPKESHFKSLDENLKNLNQIREDNLKTR